MRTLMTFDGDASPWETVNDDVMGGLSRGSSLVEDGKLQFAGTLSLRNNGGFSWVRTHRHFDLSGMTNVVLRVLGDGRRYQLRLATDAQVRGIAVSYAAEFVAPAGQWTVVRVGLYAVQPGVRGTVLDGPPLDRANVRQIGLLIADGREGPFALGVDWIGVE